MKAVRILTRIGFDPRTEKPGTVLLVPGDASFEEAKSWIARGLAEEHDEAVERAKRKEAEKAKAEADAIEALRVDSADLHEAAFALRVEAHKAGRSLSYPEAVAAAAKAAKADK